jgi:PPOX class probable F420-dependent enzyme
VGVLATAAPDGRPRQSVVDYARDGDQLLVSTRSARLKARDVQRTDWASLCVRADGQPYSWATLAGPAESLAKDIGPPTALIIQHIADNEPPEAQSDEALAAVDRVILAISVERVSAMATCRSSARVGMKSR